jgi:hypothetical protein
MREICDETAQKGWKKGEGETVNGNRTMMTECLKTPLYSLWLVKDASNNGVNNEVKGFRRKLSMTILGLPRHLTGGK